MISSLDMKAFRVARLDNKIRQLAFGVLRRLCGRTGHLPNSYLLSAKFDLSGMPRTSGGFADVQMGVFKGGGCCDKVAESRGNGRHGNDTQGNGRHGNDTQGRKTSYSFSPRIAHTSCSTYVKKWPCGRTCPIQTSSISTCLPVSFQPQSPTHRALMTHGAEDEDPVVIREYTPSCYTGVRSRVFRWR